MSEIPDYTKYEMVCKHCGHPVFWMACSIKDWRHDHPQIRGVMCQWCLAEHHDGDWSKVCMRPEPKEKKT